MEYPVDRLLFEELKRRRPQEIEFSPYCIYDEKIRCFTVSAWNGNYQINLDAASICTLPGTDDLNDLFAIFLVNYLLSEKRVQADNEWISEKDLIGGVTFFRGPHEIPTRLIVERFADDLNSLKDRCLALGGTPLDMADISFSFEIIGSVRIALLFWQGDEDFEAEAKLLVDKSLAGTLALDVVYALLCAVCSTVSTG